MSNDKTSENQIVPISGLTFSKRPARSNHGRPVKLITNYH